MKKLLIVALLCMSFVLNGSTNPDKTYNYEHCTVYMEGYPKTFDTRYYKMTWKHQLGSLIEVRAESKINDTKYYYTGNVSLYCYTRDN